MTDEQQFARFTGQQLKRYFAYHSSRRKYVLRMHYAVYYGVWPVSDIYIELISLN